MVLRIQEEVHAETALERSISSFRVEGAGKVAGGKVESVQRKKRRRFETQFMRAEWHGIE